MAHDILDYADFYAANAVEKATLEELLLQSDIVTLHLPNNETSRNILDAARIAQMKPGAILINTARGGLVDEGAVKAALQSGRLAGIGFDVFAQEPPQDAELLAMPNVLATPHIGGSAEEAVLAMGRAAILGLEDNAVP